MPVTAHAESHDDKDIRLLAVIYWRFYLVTSSVRHGRLGIMQVRRDISGV